MRIPVFLLRRLWPACLAAAHLLLYRAIGAALLVVTGMLQCGCIPLELIEELDDPLVVGCVEGCAIVIEGFEYLRDWKGAGYARRAELGENGTQIDQGPNAAERPGRICCDCTQR